MSLSCIIVDDEPNAVNLLAMLVQQNTGWQLLAKCYDAVEAMAFLKENKPDFIFLDINMPQLSGMELAGLLSKSTKIVFTTAYSEYAVESYNFQTIDYLLKPITLKRFLAAMQKIALYFEGGIAIESQAHSTAEEYFFVKSGKELRKIQLPDILYFEGEKEYVRLVTATGQMLIYRRMKDIEVQLKPPFVRVHNSFIVNTKQLSKIQDNHIFIADKQIPISEKFKDKLMGVIQQRIF